MLLKPVETFALVPLKPVVPPSAVKVALPIPVIEPPAASPSIEPVSVLVALFIKSTAAPHICSHALPAPLLNLSMPVPPCSVGVLLNEIVPDAEVSEPVAPERLHDVAWFGPSIVPVVPPFAVAVTPVTS